MDLSRRLPALSIAAVLFSLASLAIVALWLGNLSLAMWTDEGFSWALAIAATAVAALSWQANHHLPRFWILPTIAAWMWLAATLAGLDDRTSPAIAPDDLPTLLFWGLTAAAILPALGEPRLSRSSRLLLGIGFLLQSLAFGTDLGDGSIFHLPRLSDPAIGALGESSEILGLAAYLVSLVLIAIPLFQTSTGKREPLLWALVQSTPGRLAAIAWEDMRWRLFRFSHPGAAFSAFYADSIGSKLDKGKVHRTLGQASWSKSHLRAGTGERAAAFAAEGVPQFERLWAMRPEGDGAVVDYGCGSLRIGQHFIRRLGPGKYWGLDVTDRFYNDGLRLLPETLVAERAPHLAVIGEAALATAAAARPSFIFSISVMKHVPPDELEAYWRNVLSLAGTGSLVVIDGNLAHRAMRTGGKNWAYPEDRLRHILATLRPMAPLRVERLGKDMAFAGEAYDRAFLIVGPMPGYAA